jgi:hypothetical protein
VGVKEKTPTDAKRPAGVISLIGGFGGTPSPRSELNDSDRKINERYQAS